MTHKVIETALFKIIPQDDPKQAMRLRRFFMALAIYILACLLAYICYLANIMEWESVYASLIGIPLINVILYIIFRTGLNRRMPDPSLTSLQMCISILVVTYGMYYANEARGLLLLVYIPIFLFGIFRLNTRQFLFISGFALLAYGINIILLQGYHPQRVNLKIEYLQWGVLSIALVVFSFMGGHLSSIRRKLSISRAELEKSVALIREMAIHDDLTGFYNRRHMMELIEYEKNLSARTGTVFSLIMLDIDHFKNVNDTHGHQTGDQILQAIAAIIRKTLRGVDFCGRYGGEEFLFVLMQTNLHGAKLFAERLRYLIENSQFPDLGRDSRITVSLGVAEYQMKENTEKTIYRADAAMYKAKSNGRNRVECCE